MKNTFGIFIYEIKKVLHRKITVYTFFIILCLTIMLNLQSIPLYSIGAEGTQITDVSKRGERNNDWNAFFHGISIHWIDEDGKEIEKKVSPVEYIRIQRDFARKWSGKSLNEDTLQGMKDFLEKYGHEEDGYFDGWSYQNYFWVWKTISNMGVNPFNENISETTIESLLMEQTEELYDNLSLSDEEQAFWKEHKNLEFPLKMAYTPAYRQIFSNMRWIHLMILFFVILMLCESFSLDHKYRVHPILQASKLGPVYAALIRTAAGIIITIGVSICLYAVTVIIQFLIFGTDGWNAPIQQIGGLQWSRLVVTCGEAIFIMCGTSMIIAVTIAAITMAVSELSHSGNLPIWILLTFLLMTMFFDYGIFYWNRELAQIWQYLPIQRVNDALLYDERLVYIGSHYMTAIPFVLSVYLIVAMAASTVCSGHAILRRNRI